MASFSVFGYGSLIFKPPPFPFTRRDGWIVNYSRRFAQRSHDHRGTEAAYGLVSTLVDDAEWEEYREDEPIESTPIESTRCYGTVFTFDSSSDSDADVWRYLDHREKDGFTRKLVDVYAVVGGVEQVVEQDCIVYVGELSNPSFHTDPHFMSKVARRIATSTGPSGTNREYLYNLAEAIRRLSTVEDPYLALLERLKSLSLHSPECNQPFGDATKNILSRVFDNALPNFDFNTGSLFRNAHLGRGMIHENILSCIGSTPLVRMDKIAREEGFKCNLYAKCEFFSAGGSVKDRIALRMVEQAEKDGVLIPGKSVIVEASSGNTGIGLALVAAVKGYRCIITMPEKMSLEKSNTMKALGAEIIRTPTEAGHDSCFSNMGVAKRLTQEIENAVMLDQYANINNPDAHYYGTAAEIVEALSLTPADVQATASLSRPSSNHCDVLIAGAGTGGTLTGMSRRLREANEKVVIVGIDPRGSVLARPENLNTLEKGESDLYKVEGIGYDFIPAVLLHPSVDVWVKTNDVDSFSAARRLIRTEGFLCGGSCGAALSGGLEYLHSEEGQKWSQLEGANCVVLLADSIRNYITSPWLTETESDTPKVNGDAIHGKCIESITVNLKGSRIG